MLQLAVVTADHVWGANADLLPLVALSVGLLGGPDRRRDRRASSLGLVADMALVQTLGVSSLLLTGVGYLAGRYRELRDATHKLVPAIGGAASRRSPTRPASRSSSSCSASTRRSARW